MQVASDLEQRAELPRESDRETPGCKVLVGCELSWSKHDNVLTKWARGKTIQSNPRLQVLGIASSVALFCAGRVRGVACLSAPCK